MARYIGFMGEQNSYRDLLGLANRAGCIPAGAYLALAGSASPLNRIVNIMHSFMSGDHPLLSIGGYVYFVHQLAKCRDFRDIARCDNEHAISAGLVTAGWKVIANPTLNLRDVEAQLHQVARYVVEHHPSLDDDLLKAIRHMRETVIPAVGATLQELVNPGDSAYATGIYDQAETYGARLMTIVEGGMVPWTKLGGNMAQIGAAGTKEALLAALPNVLPQQWDVNLTTMEVLDICNFIGRHCADTVRPLLIRDLFISMACIGKGGNITNRWINSRWNTLCSQVTEMAAERDGPAKEVFSDYNLHFIGNSTPLNRLYSALGYNYRIGSSQNIPILKWIAEQARGSNLMGLSAIATCFTRYQMFCFQLMKEIIPDGQLIYAFQAMSITIQQPYCTLTGPAIPIQMYPDIAYVALNILHANNLEAQGIIHGLETKLAREPTRLKALAQEILRCQEDMGKNDVNVQSIVNAFSLNAYSDPYTPCAVYAYPDFANAEVDPTAGGSGLRKALNKMTRQEFDAIKHSLTQYNMNQIIAKGNDSKNAAAIKVSAQFLASISQTSLNLDVHFPATAGPVPPVVMEAEISTGITTLEAGGAPVPQIVLENAPIPNESIIKPFPVVQQ